MRFAIKHTAHTTIAKLLIVKLFKYNSIAIQQYNNYLFNY